MKKGTRRSEPRGRKRGHVVCRARTSVTVRPRARGEPPPQPDYLSIKVCTYSYIELCKASAPTFIVFLSLNKTQLVCETKAATFKYSSERYPRRRGAVRKAHAAYRGRAALIPLQLYRCSPRRRSCTRCTPHNSALSHQATL
ncbi:unnamed protein product [Arctia plantaginis]|uniref:Uncharacterized protein n=1 Tax=Arctia plantaginis TaxID=874455 RepID=A0A8S0ZUP3_ARCPL|nr:unnamed protein product [Arctia plantaginis]